MTCRPKIKFFALAALLAFLLPVFSHPARAQSSDAFRETLRRAQEKSDRADSREKFENRNEQVNAPIVIELYTAVDCTACVFADRMLYDSMKNKNVIALSCRITDLGALQSNDEKYRANNGRKNSGPMDPCIFRQWTYETGRSNTDISLGIPTFVINGLDQIGTSDLVSYESILKTYSYGYKNKVREVFMKWKDADTLSINLPSDPDAETKQVNASVWLIRYKDIDVTKVSDGQNQGRVLRFSNVVQNIKHISKWHGTVRELDIDVPKPTGGKDAGGYAVVVQEMMGEPMLAAGKLEDYPVKAPQ